MIGVRGVEDLWDLMTQTAGRKTRGAKVLYPPLASWKSVQWGCEWKCVLSMFQL